VSETEADARSPSAAPRLAAAQRRLWRLLAAPEGVRAALAEEGPEAEAALEALLAGDARAPAAARLEVYANAYFHRIAAVLRDDYPALASALGPAAFHDLATAYLLACPPRHVSLRRAGDRVAGFLASDAGGAPFFRGRWPFAADLAALEWALADAFDAPDDDPLAREALAALPPEAWAALPLRLRASVALLALAWPVDRLRRAADAGAALPLAAFAPEPTRLCVYRDGDAVRYRRLDPDAASLLESARDGTTFGALCDALAASHGPAAAPALAATHLSHWLPAFSKGTETY
jgi:hypothetical protein